MNITEITLKERQALLVGASDYEKLPDYEVNQRWLDSVKVGE